MGGRIQIPTPRGCGEQVHAGGAGMGLKFDWSASYARRMTDQFNAAQCFVDSEVLRRSSPYIPFQTGALNRSGVLGTRIGSGLVMWSAPYAANQYYNTAKTRSYDAMRGGRWFDRMKADHGKEIVAGARRIGGGG